MRNPIVEAAEFVARENQSRKEPAVEDMAAMEGADYAPPGAVPEDGGPGAPAGVNQTGERMRPDVPRYTGPPIIQAIVLEPVPAAVTSVGQFALTEEDIRRVAAVGLRAFERASRATYREIAARYKVQRMRKEGAREEKGARNRARSAGGKESSRQQ